MNNLNLGVIGNSAISALVDPQGTIVWSCMPRLDGDPVFCQLLNDDKNETGFFSVDVKDFSHSEQSYLRNTAILRTVIHDTAGNSLEIIDFAPRFKSLERTFRPMMLVRQIHPLEGHPRVTIKLRPAHSYGSGVPEQTRGSNHIRYLMPDLVLRCTTNAPISYIVKETPFILEEPIELFLGPDETLTTSMSETAVSFRNSTQAYWREWCRYLSLPFEWQEEVIRAAITLKLSNFEESGGIVAAMTTSIPESADSGRNWDYRYCWLRDANFVVKALNRLGATRTMEDHIRYITNVAATSNGNLQPVYGITLELDLIESEVDSLAGYRAMGPVRRGNQAYEHIQNDVYGSCIMAATQAFFDERLESPGNVSLFERLEKLGDHAYDLYNTPDAGLWEFRTKALVHTYSALMCWAACHRLSMIAGRLPLKDREIHWQKRAEEIHAEIMKRGFNAEMNAFTDAFEGDSMDASLLLMAEFGFIDAMDPKFIGTVEAIGNALKDGDYLYRYMTPDDFGRPETSFTICTFWYVDALASIGRVEEARALFENLLACRNDVGLLSEDIDPETRELWGNFPQTYSMVGLINSAMRLSKDWSEVL